MSGEFYTDYPPNFKAPDGDTQVTANFLVKPLHADPDVVQWRPAFSSEVGRTVIELKDGPFFLRSAEPLRIGGLGSTLLPYGYEPSGVSHYVTSADLLKPIKSDTAAWRVPTHFEIGNQVCKLNAEPYSLHVCTPVQLQVRLVELKPKVPQAKVVRPRRPAAPVLLPSYAIRELTYTEPILYGDKLTRINPADNIPDQDIFSDWIGSLASRAQVLGWKVVRHIPIPATPFTKTDSGLVVQFEPNDPPAPIKEKALGIIAQYLADLSKQLGCLSNSSFTGIKTVTLRLTHRPVGAGTKLVSLPKCAVLLGSRDEIQVGDKRLLVSDNMRSSEEDVPFSWIGLRAEQISVNWEVYRYT